MVNNWANSLSIVFYRKSSIPWLVNKNRPYSTAVVLLNASKELLVLETGNLPLLHIVLSTYMYTPGCVAIHRMQWIELPRIECSKVALSYTGCTYKWLNLLLAASNVIFTFSPPRSNICRTGFNTRSLELPIFILLRYQTISISKHFLFVLL